MEVGVRLDKMTLGGDVVHGLSGKISYCCVIDSILSCTNTITLQT